MFYSEDNNLDSISETFSSDTDNADKNTNLSLMSILENCRQLRGGASDNEFKIQWDCPLKDTQFNPRGQGSRFELDQAAKARSEDMGVEYVDNYDENSPEVINYSCKMIVGFDTLNMYLKTLSDFKPDAKNKQANQIRTENPNYSHITTPMHLLFHIIETKIPNIKQILQKIVWVLNKEAHSIDYTKYQNHYTDNRFSRKALTRIQTAVINPGKSINPFDIMLYNSQFMLFINALLNQLMYYETSNGERYKYNSEHKSNYQNGWVILDISGNGNKSTQIFSKKAVLKFLQFIYDDQSDNLVEDALQRQQHLSTEKPDYIKDEKLEFIPASYPPIQSEVEHTIDSPATILLQPVAPPVAAAAVDTVPADPAPSPADLAAAAPPVAATAVDTVPADPAPSPADLAAAAPQQTTEQLIQKYLSNYTEGIREFYNYLERSDEWSNQFLKTNDNIIRMTTEYLKMVTDFLTEINRIATQIYYMKPSTDLLNKDVLKVIGNLKYQLNPPNLEKILILFNVIQILSKQIKLRFDNTLLTNKQINDQFVSLKESFESKKLWGIPTKPLLTTLFRLDNESMTFSEFVFQIIPTQLKRIINELQSIVTYEKSDNDNLTILLNTVEYMRKFIQGTGDDLNMEMLSDLSTFKTRRESFNKPRKRKSLLDAYEMAKIDGGGGGSKSQYKTPSRSFNIFTDILHYYLQFHNKSYNKAVISTHKRLYHLIKQTTNKVEKNNYINAYYLYNILYSNYYERNPNLSSKKIHSSLQKILTN